MDKQGLLNKISFIIQDLKSHHSRLTGNALQSLDLELELFLTNARYLVEHLEVLKKLGPELHSSPVHPNSISAIASSNALHSNLNSAHPGADSVHLNVNSVHPNVNSAYPNSNSAYPNSIPAYPNSIPTHPNSNPAYSNLNPVYPHSNPAYPNSNPAYPNLNAEHYNPGSANPNSIQSFHNSNPNTHNSNFPNPNLNSSHPNSFELPSYFGASQYDGNANGNDLPPRILEKDRLHSGTTDYIDLKPKNPVSQLPDQFAMPPGAREFPDPNPRLKQVKESKMNFPLGNKQGVFGPMLERRAAQLSAKLANELNISNSLGKENPDFVRLSSSESNIVNLLLPNAGLPSPSINEQLAGINQSENVKGKVNKLPIREIRKAIGLNDHLLFIRSLFGGDPSAYDRTLSILDGLPDLKAAQEYLDKEVAILFQWTDRNHAAALFRAIIMRRFSGW